MFWANFLHFYQPPDQQKDILEQVVNESYRPLLQGFLARPFALATFNINGGLLELWERNGYQELIGIVKKLVERGQIELTGSAKYHAFLPLLPKEEIVRQIDLNTQVLKKYLGKDLNLAGFFTPELAFDKKVGRIVGELGFEWMVAPQIAYGQYPPKFDLTYEMAFSREVFTGELSEGPKKDTNAKAHAKTRPGPGEDNLKIFFRDKRLSVLILSGYAHNWENLQAEIPDYFEHKRYSISMMDAETFGHHRPGLEELLFEIYDVSESEKEAGHHFVPTLISDLPEFFPQIEAVTPRPSTWSNEEQDFWLDKEQSKQSQHPFLLWKDPQNEIHALQWEFLYWVIEEVKNQKSKVKTKKDHLRWRQARSLLDQALSSDQYWWASAKPWWSLEMIEQGAYKLREVVYTLGEDTRKAQNYYRRILALAFEWQRTGKVRQMHRGESGSWRRIPFKNRATQDEYKQFILEFEDEMKKAASRLEFEKAIKWRDAVIKLKKGTDIYDAFHVVDQLWAARSKIPQLKSWRAHNQDKLPNFVKDAWGAWEGKSWRS